MYLEFVRCGFVSRYGGISLGELNDLIQANNSVIEDSVHRILAAANGGERAAVNVTVPDVIRDLEDLIELGVTRRNGKVSGSPCRIVEF